MFILLFVGILVSIAAIYVRQNYIKNKISEVVDVPHSNPAPHEVQNTDKIIWSYWSGTEIPLSVKLALFSWKHHNPGYFVVLLNEANVTDYVDVTTFPAVYPELQPQHRADVIRLAVLERYGGYWCDATYYVTKPLAERWEPRSYDVGGYYQDMFTVYLDKPVLENWFISAPPGSPLIREWRREFYRGLDYKNPNQYIQEIQQEVDLQAIPDNFKNYLMMHCAFLRVIEQKTYRIKAYSALKNGPFDYMDKNRWNPVVGVAYLVWVLAGEDAPEGLKLRGGERGILEHAWWLYRSGSILDLSVR